MKKKKRVDYKNYIVVIVALIVLIVIFGIYKLMNSNKNPILIGKDENLSLADSYC